MLRTIGTALLGLLLAVGLAAGPAAAYPVEQPGASVSSSTVAPGGTVTFSATGFAAGSGVALSVALVGGGEVSSQDLVADGSGAVSAAVTLPSQPGTYRLTATGVGPDGEPVVVSAEVLVSGGAAGGAGTGTDGAGGAAAGGGATTGALARTGLDGAATLLWVGAGVLLLGGVLVAVAAGPRRRRQAGTA